MAYIPLTGTLGTGSPTETFATHESNLGRGGHHSVADKAARNAITTERRQVGMLVYTESDGKFWYLSSDANTGTDDDWTVFGSGTSVPVASEEFQFPTAQTTWIMNHSLGGYPTVTLKDLNGVTFDGVAEYPSTSQVRVEFLVPGGMAGSATLKNRG